MKIVIDTNVWISATISKKMNLRLFNIINNSLIEIIGNHLLIQELKLTLSKPKLQKYISQETSKKLLVILNNRLDFIESKSEINICRDPNDNFLLALCKDGNVNYLISGDKDLLILNPFENTKILTLTEFELILSNQ